MAVISSRGLLREGNAVSNFCFSIATMIGPAIGGILVAAGGTRVALFVTTGLFALVAVDLATARGLPEPTLAARPGGHPIRAALDYARRHAAIRSLVGIQAAALFFFTLSIPVEVVYTQHSLHAGAGGYGALLAAWGAGVVAGSAVYLRWRGADARPLIALSALALMVGLGGMAAAPSLSVALLAAGMAGVGNGVEAVAVRTALQEQTDESWMALIMSFNDSMSKAVPGLGIVAGGVIATLAGPRAALAVGAAGSLAIAAASWAVLRPHPVVLRPAAEPPPL